MARHRQINFRRIQHGMNITKQWECANNQWAMPLTVFSPLCHPVWSMNCVTSRDLNSSQKTNAQSNTLHTDVFQNPWSFESMCTFLMRSTQTLDSNMQNENLQDCIFNAKWHFNKSHTQKKLRPMALQTANTACVVTNHVHCQHHRILPSLAQSCTSLNNICKNLTHAHWQPNKIKSQHAHQTHNTIPHTTSTCSPKWIASAFKLRSTRVLCRIQKRNKLNGKKPQIINFNSNRWTWPNTNRVWATTQIMTTSNLNLRINHQLAIEIEMRHRICSQNANATCT